MIKCPTCGTQIQVPPQAAGQIVKCPGCGKGLKLVAKAKPAGQQQQSAGTGMGMSANPGGSVAGGSVSALTFVGDVPPIDRAGPALDDMPSLESNCAVCGRATDPNDLVEDNGRLVCMDCVKGARSAIARPEGGAELIDFKPSAAPVRRGKLINFSPSFFVGTLAALVLIGTQVYLTLFEKPVGTLTPGARASRATPAEAGAGTGGSAVAAAPDEGTAAATPTPAPADTPTDATAATTPPPAPAPDDASAAGAAPATPGDSVSGEPTPAPEETESTSATSPTAVAMATTNPGEAEAGSMFTNDNIGTPGGSDAAGANGAPAGAGDPANAAAGAPDVPAAPPTAIVSNDPLLRGLERLIARDYAKAITDLDQARLRYVINKMGPVGRPLTPQQQMTLEGLAAAYIGQGRVDAARGPLEAAHARNVRSRSLLLNTAIYMINGQRQLPSMLQAADLVRGVLAGPANDEYAADVFGTLINKIDQMDKAPQDRVDALWAAHDAYVDQLAARGDVPDVAGKLKWGVDWMPAEEVKQFRKARGLTNRATGIAAAAKEVELAAARRRSAETALRIATDAQKNNQPADVKGAQAQLDAANAALAKATKTLQEAGAAMNYKPPRWLTKFEPVIPQRLEIP